MILVTGGTGFLGKRLVRKLVESGCDRIRCLVRPGTSAAVFQSDLEDRTSADIELFAASFNDKTALENALKNVDTVYHAASSKQGSVASMTANTVVGSDNLYQASVNARVSRFVLVSSLGVMGVSNLPRNEVIDEKVPLEKHPEWRDAYTYTKHRQETLAMEYYRESGLPLVVVRPGVIFGPGSPILSTRIGVDLLGVFLHLGGDNLIPLTYVDNCAEAIVLAGTVKGIEGETFCIADDDVPTSRTILKRYRKEVNSLRSIRIPYGLLRVLAEINVWFNKRTQGHIPAVFTPYEVATVWKGHRLTNRKAKELLHWHPRISMNDALNITFSSIAFKKK